MPAGSQVAGNTAAKTGANLTAAQAALAPYSNGKTAPFPADAPLSKPVPPGTKFAYLQAGDAASALVVALVRQAVEKVGGTLTAVNIGTTAASEQAAASTVLAMKPAAVMLIGINVQGFGNGLRKLSAAGIKVVSISLPQDVSQFGITFNVQGAPTYALAGRLMADWAIGKKGAKANVTFYGIPEIAFTATMQQAFVGEMRKNCPGCHVRTESVPIASMGTTAPRTIVTDLQAHPGTNVAVFTNGQLASGLPAAFKSAGLSLDTITWSPNPGNLQDIKSGGLSAGLAVDFPTGVDAMVDAAFRLVVGDSPTQAEKASWVPIQLLEQKDITFDPSKGWTAYPDYLQRYSNLWRVAS